MATIHILTKNNERTIQKTLDSIEKCGFDVLVGDMGSTDETVKICREQGIQVYNTREMKRNEARNHLCRVSKQGWMMYIEPWEIIVKGHNIIEKMNGLGYYGTVIQDGFVTKDLRFWKQGEFINPVYERIDLELEDEIEVVFYSSGNPNSYLEEIKQWKIESPMSPKPYYYHACECLSKGEYDQFLNLSDHYMAMEINKNCMSAIMNRYYYALVQILHKKKLRPTLQNLNICLCAKPLMAEFWCLMGDAFYHLDNDFSKAKEFYRNALFLGSKRSKTDKYPMEISKYKEYPKKMLANCEEILSYRSTWIR